jgi:hypothetical protein
VVFVQYPLCSYSGYKIQTLDVKELSLRKLWPKQVQMTSY